jgi:hypothetical protein
MEVRLREAVDDPRLGNDLGNDDGQLVLYSVANLDWDRNVGPCAGGRKLIEEEKQISNPDRSFYRRNDNDLLRLIFYFILWCSIPVLLFGLWLHITGQLHITGHGT